MAESEKALGNVRASSLEASTVNVAEVAFANRDEAELAALGKKQQFRVNQVACIIGLWLTVGLEKLWLPRCSWLCLYVDDNLGRGFDVSAIYFLNILNTQNLTS